MNKVTFYIGQGKDKDGKSIAYSLPRLKAQANALLTSTFGAYTILHGAGMWQGVSEPCDVVIVYTTETSQVVGRVAAQLAIIFNQSCVALEITPSVRFVLIDQDQNEV